MTIIEDLESSTRNVFITPEISEELDNAKISAETIDILEKIEGIFYDLNDDNAIKVLEEEDENQVKEAEWWEDLVADKLCIGYYFRMISEVLKKKENLLAARLLGIVEIEESEDLMPGFYIFLPSGEEDKIFCGYINREGGTIFHTFKYPFEYSTYLDLLKILKGELIDDFLEITDFADVLENLYADIKMGGSLSSNISYNYWDPFLFSIGNVQGGQETLFDINTSNLKSEVPENQRLEKLVKLLTKFHFLGKDAIWSTTEEMLWRDEILPQIEKVLENIGSIKKVEELVLFNESVAVLPLKMEEDGTISGVAISERLLKATDIDVYHSIGARFSNVSPEMLTSANLTEFVESIDIPKKISDKYSTCYLRSLLLNESVKISNSDTETVFCIEEAVDRVNSFEVGS